MRNGSDFTAVVRRGRRAGRSSLVVHYASTAEPGSAEPRVGFVVPKSVGNAVVRNRVQRRLRHLMRDRVAGLPRDSLVVVRAQPAAARATDLRPELDSALSAVLRPRADARRGDRRPPQVTG